METKNSPLSKETFIREELNGILHPGNPLPKLEAVCRDIPCVLPHHRAGELKLQGETEELIYLCLPTLLSGVVNHSGLGLGPRKLFEEGLTVLEESIEIWRPDKKLRNGRPDFLKAFAARKIGTKLEELIVRAHGLAGRHNFPVVKLYRRCLQELTEREGRTPTLAQIKNLVEASNVAGLPLNLKGESKVVIMYRASLPEISLEQAGEQLAADPEREVSLGILRKEVPELLARLRPEESKVLQLRFGLADGQPRTLGEVGSQLGKTATRVRGIEAKALRKLRHPSLSSKVHGYLD